MLRRQISISSMLQWRYLSFRQNQTLVVPSTTPWTFHDRKFRALSSTPSPHNYATVKHNGRNVAKEPISEAQRRSAQLELDQMTQSTARLIAITDSSLINDAIINEARVALHYWSRRWYMHFHPGFGRAAKGSSLSLDALRNSSPRPVKDKMLADNDVSENNSTPIQQRSGDYGARQAEIILDWSISHNLVPRGIFNLEGIYSPLDYDLIDDYGSSPNMTFAQIIDTYLLPCAFNGVGCFGSYSNEDQINLLAGDTDQRHYATLSKHYTKNPRYIKAVVDATRIMKKMRNVQATFPEHISPDTLSVKSELNVCSKRSMILGADHTGAQTGGILAGNIVAGHVNNINSTEMLKSIENNHTMEDNFYTLEGCLREMETILTKAEDYYISTHDNTIKPSVDWYNHILGSWARSDLKEAPDRAKEMLRGMEAFEGVRDRDNGNFRTCWARADIISYNSVLFCLARDATIARAEEALNLFNELKTRYNQSKNEYIRPDEVTYGSILHALAQVGMAREAENILDSIEEQSMESDCVVPGLTIYNTVLNAWANSAEHNAPRKAELLLERMKSLSSSGENPDIEPDIVSISTVMSCHARNKRRDGAERAEELLNEAIKSYETMGNAKMKPDSIMFNCAILAWAYCGNSRDDVIPAERAEQLLHKLLELRNNNTLEIAPMAQTYNLVIDSWAKSNRNDAADRALQLMRRMSDAGITPDECSYNSVLNAMSKQDDPSSVGKAVELFQELETLSQHGKLVISDMTYNVMMNVHGKSGNKNGAEKAEQLLRTMEHNGPAPTVISYNSCIDAYARRGAIAKAESLVDEMIGLAAQGKEYLRPTIHSFAALINAIANSGVPDAIDKAELIVKRVEELDFVKPNTVLYNSLINTIVKSGRKDSAARADRVLNRMEQVRLSGNSDVNPDSYAYSMVLTLCARSNEDDAAVRASNILDSMEGLYSQGHTNVIANSRCYSAVITAWARSGSPDNVKHAFDLIDRMEQNKRNNSPHGTPNSHCYNACIHAIAKSSNQEKVKHCLDILQRMIDAKNAGDIDSAPTIVTYSTIVNACAYTNGNKDERKKAFELSRSCLQAVLMSKELKADESMFTNIFLVICRHLGKGEARDRFAEAVFKEACKLGKVDNQVLHHFRNASHFAANRLLPDINSAKIPVEWSNAVGKCRDKYRLQ